MKTILATTLALAIGLPAAAWATDDGAASGAAPAASAAPSAPVANADFCLYGGVPTVDAKYTVIKALDVSKGTYGGVADELPTLVAQAKAVGADAIVHYNGAQHFGFWPWSFVRPVVSGEAVRWNNPPGPECAVSGGATLGVTLATRAVPPRH